MKNIFEEEKKFDSRARFYFGKKSYWAYFGQSEDFKLTTEQSKNSAMFPQTSNQKRRGSNEAILLMSINLYEALLSR